MARCQRNDKCPLPSKGLNIKPELPKIFSPRNVEKKWYLKWEEEGYFRPTPRKGKQTFCLIMPPPNVTGILHMGHALNTTTQDILTRYKRMKGHETLWLPGMDHAGIATQSVVEKKLYKEEEKTRQDYNREEFLKKVWDWKEHHGGVIQQQQRSLGASCDWNYALFTMDTEANQAVNKAFVDMYNEGLIYQSDYIVNWDTELQTAISDAEVEHREIKGAYYHIRYSIKGSNDSLIVATTRPETLLGDTALAVHPEDKRFKKYIGQKAIVPLCNREVPIVGDSYVDREKGTGCLKVTPGHDFNDFDLGKRHGLKIINILNKAGILNEHGLEWEGYPVLKARILVLKRLKQLELLVKEEEVVHQVGHGERSKTVIEPIVSKQWFLKTKDMAHLAVEAVKKEDMRFFPKGWENTYFSWLKSPKDWCISRQLWWGHRIPVFTCLSCSHQWAQEKLPQTCPHCQEKRWEQDPDVLDTWFSSALWPFSTLGWPSKERMKERGLERFYPTSVLVTGFDIIFFWVARMMMMGLKHLKAIPFHHVYIHAIVRDKHGRKMSKSLGNGIDPMKICQEYGADSLRFTLAADSGYNRTLNLDPARIAGYRNFINKLWNAFRFVYPFLNESKESFRPNELDHQDRWILSELNSVVKKMNESLEEYRFDDACSAIYQFTYEKFCSWYIEFSKPILHGDHQKEEGSDCHGNAKSLANQKDKQLQEKRVIRATVLNYCLKKMMALLHPIAPFISEEIWHYIKDQKDTKLIVVQYPKYDKNHLFQKDQSEMNRFIDVVTKIRNLRQSVNLPPKQEIDLHIFTDHQELKNYLNQNSVFLFNLVRAKNLKVKEKSGPRPEKSIMTATSFYEIFIPLSKVNLEEQSFRLKKELLKTEKELERFEKKLSNKNFMGKAPESVVLEIQEKAQKYRAQLENLKGSLRSFQS